MSLPSAVGLPSEMQLGHLDSSLPPDAKSFSVKIQPSNVSSVTGTFTTPIGVNGSTTCGGDMAFPVQNIIFDLPCGQSPSMFLDNRFTTLNFTATLTLNTGASTNSVCSATYLRSGANSYFDRMFITGQSGQILEDIGEYGLVNDTLVALQMNCAVRRGVANQYGFNSNVIKSSGIDYGVLEGSQGHPFPSAGQNTGGNSETHSYSVPLLSGIVGCTADKFLNIGRTSKLQINLQTTNIVPITFYNSTTSVSGAQNGANFTLTLSNFSLQCEYVDIGHSALSLLDATLENGKSYIHGTTYRTSSVTLPSVMGSTSLLAGIRASSVKSLFTRFSQGGPASTSTSTNGKYDSPNPILNSINYNVGGIKYPQTPINPLLQPSQAFRETQMAIGSFNSSQFQSSISPANYCKLSAGGTAQGYTNGNSQDMNWSLGSSAIEQQQFIFGECMEVCARRGLLSGLNCTTAPIFVEMNLSASPSNSHTCYVQAMLDHVVIHDVKTGDIQVRILKKYHHIITR